MKYRPKHLIQISAYYPPHLGGQENVVYDLAQQLAKRGHHVEVLTSDQGGGKSHSLDGDVLVQRCKSFVFGHAPVMMQFPFKLLRAVREHSIVHVHIGQAFTPEIVWLLAKLRGFRYIAELHIDFQPTGPAGFLLPLYKQYILKRVLQSADAVLTLNEKTLNLVRNEYERTGPTQVISNGIEERYFTLDRKAFTKKPPKTLRLVYIGRLSKQKNIIPLLHAIAGTHHKVHLDLIGDGEERELIEQTIASLDLSNVTMHGRLPRDEVLDYYAKSDALVMPSLYEAQPLVLLEAMAARIPIIGTDVIGVAEHLDGAGIIVAPTISGLKQGIDRYFTEYNSLPDKVKQGYERAERLRWSNVLTDYEELYEAVAQR